MCPTPVSWNPQQKHAMYSPSRYADVSDSDSRFASSESALLYNDTEAHYSANAGRICVNSPLRSSSAGKQVHPRTSSEDMQSLFRASGALPISVGSDLSVEAFDLDIDESLGTDLSTTFILCMNPKSDIGQDPSTAAIVDGSRCSTNEHASSPLRLPQSSPYFSAATSRRHENQLDPAFYLNAVHVQRLPSTVGLTMEEVYGVPASATSVEAPLHHSPSSLVSPRLARDASRPDQAKINTMTLSVSAPASQNPREVTISQ